MKKIVFLTILFFTSQVLQAKKDTILLFYPSATNITTIEFLLENDILQLDDFHFKGVYHSSEAYNYAESQKYLEANPGLPFSLHGVQNELPGNMIYEINQCSREFESLFRTSKGAIFLGGPDLPPGTYGEANHLLSMVIDHGRHYFELSYLFHILGGEQNSKQEALMMKNPDYGVLGICLGMQTINVATGGTMIQDIPQEVYGLSFVEEINGSDPDMVHRNYILREPDNDTDSIYYTSYHFHPILVKSGFPSYSKKPASKKSYPYVLSSHHQAIQEIGKGLKPVAVSKDGKIIEAIVHKEFKNVFGVQFHPENTALYDLKKQYRITSDSIINFNQFIIENDSYEFHQSLWKSISKLFK